MIITKIFNVIGIVLGSIIGLLILYQVFIRLLRKLIHFPAPAFIGRFLDSDLRRSMQPPEKVIERSGIKENMVAAEIGCGSGAFTTFTARAVGKNGTIYALDIQQDMLDQLKKKLEKEQFKDIKNIKLLLGSAYELPLDDESVDIVYFVSVFQEIPDIPRVLKETKRVLKENGVLAISEFFFDPDYPLRKTTLKQGLAGGFILEGIFGNFWNYTARFKKSLTL